MGKKKAKVEPINTEIGSYLEAFEIFKNLPTFPTLMNVMNKALTAGCGYEQIYSEVGRITCVDFEKFFSAHGSRSYILNHKTFESIGGFNPRSTNLIDVADVIWRFITQIKFTDLITSKNALVNYQDWNELGIHDPVIEEVTKSDEDIEYSKSMRSALDGAMSKFVDAIIKQEKTSKEFFEESKKDNIGMFPWSFFIKDVLKQRNDLKETLVDFSDYLEQYFKARNELSVPELGVHSNKIDLSAKNKNYVVKIISVIFFKNLLQEQIFKSSPVSFETFFSDRIQYLSNFDEIDGIQPKTDYLIAISNLLMISAALDVNGISESIFTKEELDREFYLYLDSAKYDDHSIVFLPKSAIPSIIENINPWEGERPEELNFGDLFVNVSFGKLTAIDEDDFDDYLEDLFSGFDLELELSLKKIIKQNISKWIIPLYAVSNISFLCSDYDLLDHEIVSERISRSLKKSDDEVTDHACIFLTKDLEDVNTPIWINSRSHPALFARVLSSHTNSIEYRPSDWNDLILSLDNAGQYKFACGVMAAMILIQGMIHYYSPDSKEKISPSKISATLKKLSIHRDFNMVEVSINDFFELYKDAPSIYKGSLGSFLPKTKLKLISSSAVEQDKIAQVKKELIVKDINLDLLEPIAGDLIAKGYLLSRDKVFQKFDLSLNALNNYLMAIEGELRARIGNIDQNLLEELSYKKIDVAAKFNGTSKKSSIKGLVSIAKILQTFESLSLSAKSKLKQLETLATHTNLNFFTSSIYELTSIRNPINHGDLDSLKPLNIQISLKDAEKILFENNFLKILCDTKIT